MQELALPDLSIHLLGPAEVDLQVDGRSPATRCRQPRGCGRNPRAVGSTRENRPGRAGRMRPNVGGSATSVTGPGAGVLLQNPPPLPSECFAFVSATDS